MVDTPHPNRPQEVRSDDHLKTARRDHGRGRARHRRCGRGHRERGRRNDDTDNDASKHDEHAKHAIQIDDTDDAEPDTEIGPAERETMPEHGLGLY